MSVLCITVSGAAQKMTGQLVSTAFDCAALGSETFVAQLASTVVTQPTLQDIFAVPVSTDLQQMWWLGFGLPILCYMTAWGFGILINFFNPEHDKH